MLLYCFKALSTRNPGHSQNAPHGQPGDRTKDAT